MIYFRYYLQPLLPRLRRVDLCVVDTFAATDFAHAGDEIREALPGIPVELLPPDDVQVIGTGQLLLWPIADVQRPGRLPPLARSVLRRGGALGLVNPRRRDLVVIEPEHYRRWRRRSWQTQAFERMIGWTRRLGLVA